MERDTELIGGPRSLVHYPRGWGMASNTPFRLYKGQTYAGGVRVPFVLSWPEGLPRATEDAGVRHQYVTDVTPILLDLASVPRPERWRSRPAQEPDGVSFAPVLRDWRTESAHREQYCEMSGNRSFYRDGWKLVTLHRPGTPYDDGEWALYDLRTDPTETTDVAADHPEVVKERFPWPGASSMSAVGVPSKRTRYGHSALRRRTPSTSWGMLPGGAPHGPWPPTGRGRQATAGV
ncbi:hypothetical protein ADL29_12310 [Streptomyces chattanoogensis]|uniref:N-sulphoglucosamine sulphohydrolase C-terminal domain-containing protein n=1 Tax=Streptomyces chattanoogensis TaxID=66876 RepID=A0A0N0H1J9_9ACTN|nr:hypothetical protein ADL29_12310 [Streptomyces chattanoogensis]